MSEKEEEKAKKQQKGNAVVRFLKKWWAWRKVYRRHIVHRIFTFLPRFAFRVFAIFLALVFILRVPFVQRFCIDKATAYLSKELKTTVKIDYFNLDFFDELRINGLYIADQKKDTLLYVQTLRADVNYISLLLGRLQLDAVILDSTRLRLDRDSMSYAYNSQFVSDYFSPPNSKDTTKKKPFDFRVSNLRLSNFRFTKDDRWRGQRLGINIKACNVQTNQMNLPKELIDLQSVAIYDPTFQIEEFKPSSLPPKPIDSTKIAQKKPINPEDEGKIQGWDNNFQFGIGSLLVKGGKFNNDNYVREPIKLLPDSLLDFEHLKVFDFNVALHQFLYTKGEFRGSVDGISLKDASGFICEKLAANEAIVNSQRLELNGLQIVTPYSTAGDTLVFQYSTWSDFRQFNDNVIMDIRLNDSKIRIDDIMTFAPKLENNRFFRLNRKQLATIDGRVFGKVNSLKADKLSLKLGENFAIKGNFNTRNLAVRDEEQINLKLDRLSTDMRTLRQLIPDFNPTENFDRLGNLDFEGRFDGFFADFVADGSLRTDIGRAAMSMRLDLKAGREKATYSGDLALDAFDVGKFSNNTDVGKITFKTTVKNGVGLDKNTRADLVALVDKFSFKQYEYRNANLTGELQAGRFLGQLGIKDENVDFAFDGTVNFLEKKPIFNFKSQIRKIDLFRINLAKQSVVLAGNLDFNLQGDNISDIIGKATVSNFNIERKMPNSLVAEKYHLDTVAFNSTVDADSTQHFSLISEILTAHLNGQFDLVNLPNAMMQVFERHHPRLAENFGLKSNGKPMKPQDFQFDLYIKNSKNLTRLIDHRLDTLREVVASGQLSNLRDLAIWTMEVPNLNFDNLSFTDILIRNNAKGEIASIGLDVYHTKIGKNHFGTITTRTLFNRDTLNINVNSEENFANNIGMNDLRFDTRMVPTDSNRYDLRFNTSSLRLLNNSWRIDTLNRIVFGKNYLNIERFFLQNGEQQIKVESQNQKGLAVKLQNFDFDFINKLGTDDRFRLSGKFNINAEVGDIVGFKNLSANLIADTFRVNGDDRGKLTFNASGKDLKSPLRGQMVLARGFQILDAEAAYYINPCDTFAANSLDVKLGLQQIPFEALRYLVQSGMSDLVGRVDGKLHISGQLKKLNYNGRLNLYNAGVTIDYLKTRLNVRNDFLNITNSRFDATGATIYDNDGNPATITGGLTHDRFRNFGLNLRVKSDRFTFLNTTRENNNLYYGKAVGRGDVAFTGSFQRTDIRVRAVAGKDTKITFPFGKDQNASAITFVKFKNRNPTVKDSININTNSPTNIGEPKGLNLDMDLSFNEEAEVNLIFDEAAGDNIRARGRGDIQLSFNRAGELRMSGEYRIVRGDYLFTLLRVVNKNFVIREGGTIRWFGSPFDAYINLDAEYKGLTTSPYNFIEEYINSDDRAKQEAQRPTSVDLSLHLEGGLQKPDISFAMGFPKLTGNIKSFAESKLRLLRQEPNEFNRQVFSLIVLGGFLPSDVAFGSRQQLASGGINTLSERASTLVSSFFNQLISEYVSGFDLEVGYSFYSGDANSSDLNAAARTGEQFRVRGQYNFLDNRTTISAGVGVERGSFTAASNQGNVFVGGDLAIDYSITDDRRLKLRISQVYDQVLEGRRYKPAVGLRYRKEFDTFEEFLKSLNILGKKS